MRLDEITKTTRGIILYNADFFICDLARFKDGCLPVPGFDDRIMSEPAEIDLKPVHTIHVDDIRKEFSSDIHSVTIDNVNCYESMMSMYSDFPDEIFELFLDTSRPLSGTVYEIPSSYEQLKIIVPDIWAAS